jgi:transposase-like protein
LDGIDQLVLSLTARGLTTGEIAAHFAEVYGATVSKDTISRISDKVLEEMAEWRDRPLDKVYPVLFIDALMVKVRDGQVTNRPIYVVVGVTVNGERDILGLWAGDGGEGAKFWLGVLTEIKNRGVQDVCITVCDGLKGLPEAVTTAWPLAVVQTCVLHLIRNTFRYASRRDWDTMAKDLRPVYTAATEAAAAARFDEFTQAWGGRYPAIIKLWRAAWQEFIPFLDYDVEIRRVLCSTNAIESLNARYRRAIKARGHFPSEQTPLANSLRVAARLVGSGFGRCCRGMIGFDDLEWWRCRCGRARIMEYLRRPSVWRGRRFRTRRFACGCATCSVRCLLTRRSPDCSLGVDVRPSRRERWRSSASCSSLRG